MDLYHSNYKYKIFSIDFLLLHEILMHNFLNPLVSVTITNLDNIRRLLLLKTRRFGHWILSREILALNTLLTYIQRNTFPPR
jgi:hypothetical protein